MVQKFLASVFCREDIKLAFFQPMENFIILLTVHQIKDNLITESISLFNF